VNWLLDTNVVSALRKGSRCHPGVKRWAAEQPTDSFHTSVLMLGEIRRGVDGLLRRDAAQARVLAAWLERVRLAFAGRILEVTEEIADTWGRADVPDPLPVVDGLMAATAKVHGLMLVTRNTADFARSGAHVLNPFERI
jgi:toxin FitB